MLAAVQQQRGHGCSLAVAAGNARVALHSAQSPFKNNSAILHPRGLSASSARRWSPSPKASPSCLVDG
eukprot:136405-Alexandrium_andersonii.AAC.1